MMGKNLESIVNTLRKWPLNASTTILFGFTAWWASLFPWDSYKDWRWGAWAILFCGPLVGYATAKTAGVALQRMKIAYKRLPKRGMLKKKKKVTLSKFPKLKKADYYVYTKAWIKASYKALKDDPGWFDELRIAEEAFPNSLLTPILRYYSALKNRQVSFFQLRDILRTFQRINYKPNIFTAFTAKDTLEDQSENPIHPLDRGLLNYLLGWNDDAIENIRKTVEDPRSSLEERLFAAELLEEVFDGANAIRPEWDQMRRMLWDGLAHDLPLEECYQISESKNKVYRIRSGGIIEEMFLLKESNVLEEERETTERVQGIVGKYKGYFVSKPVAEVEREGKPLLVVRREPGKTLYEMIKKGEEYKPLLKPIADILGVIHARFPKEKAGPQENLRELFEERLSIPEIDERTRQRFKKAYAPVEEALKATTFVYYKDGHAENWIYGDNGQIGVLDCEKTRQIPQEVDLVNLMDYAHTLGKEEKQEIIEHYLRQYNRHSEKKITDKEGFNLRYQNARIHIGVSRNAGMRGRKDRQVERRLFLKGARNAIYAIKKEHQEYYQRFRGEYVQLYLGFRTLMVQNKERC
ncbi:MAG TPA: phosphotransferase [Candidatus Nanoarchaeia archaeon]|nr:phosphotransferase [Candidatus Nanoarchaeia archaeon]